MAGSFPSDSLGLGLASIGSPGYGGTHGDDGSHVGECGDGAHVVMVLMVTIAENVVM